MDRSLRLTGGMLAGWLLFAAALPVPPARGGEQPAAASPSAAGAPAAASSPAALAGSIEELWARGERFFEQGDLQSALEAFSAALSRDERRARSWSYLGGAHFAQGDFPRAVEEFRRAVQLDPGDVRAVNNLGSALERLGNVAEAEQQYLQATRLAPLYAPGWRNLGILYAGRLGRPDAARDAWRRYLGLAPAGPDTEEIRRALDALDREPAAPAAR